MASYPYLVQAAWYTLSAVLSDWQKEPFRWARERDLQAEIGGRLSQVLSMQGLGSVTGKYGHGLADFSEEQAWARVAYEPYVSYVDPETGKSCWCHPDIVLWDDLGKRSTPNYQAREIWPIAWACEIKYRSADPGDWDRRKLTLLHSQGRINYGCMVDVQLSRKTSGVDVEWNKIAGERFLWHCCVHAPAAIAVSASGEN